MKYVVVDTDVFSQLFRRQDAGQYEHHLTGVIPVLSFRVCRGAALRRVGRQLGRATAP